MFNKRTLSFGLSLLMAITLTACSSNSNNKVKIGHSHSVRSGVGVVDLNNHQAVVKALEKQHYKWRNARYRLGGNSLRGTDCSGFAQLTYRELFGINLPRMTIDQVKEGNQVSRQQLKPGDLVFFKTGRGPNGRHVGIYAGNGRFLHASIKGGVIYSDMNSPYWTKTFWQGRRI